MLTSFKAQLYPHTALSSGAHPILLCAVIYISSCCPFRQAVLLNTPPAEHSQQDLSAAALLLTYHHNDHNLLPLYCYPLSMLNINLGPTIDCRRHLLQSYGKYWALFCSSGDGGIQRSMLCCFGEEQKMSVHSHF